jgi:hypothetical protein
VLVLVQVSVFPHSLVSFPFIPFSHFILTNLSSPLRRLGTGAEHPNGEGSGTGGNTYRGRGAPEIDVLEAELNKLTQEGQVVSQSAQFAPFTHDYVFGNVSALLPI